MNKAIKRLTMTQDIFGIRTRVYTVQKAWDLSCALMRAGAEGVQNDSSRYNDIMIANAFESGYCWIGLCGGCLRVISVHDTKGKKYLLDVSESKFIEALNLTVIKTKLPKSLRNYDKRRTDYPSNRSNSGYKTIKVTNIACGFYEPKAKGVEQ